MPDTPRAAAPQAGTAGRLTGAVAFVTGIARGQGRAHAVRLAQEGADIVGLDLAAPVPSMGYPTGTAKELEDTVALVQATGRRIVARAADVRDRASIETLLDDAVEEFGRLDIVVANAGVSPPALPMWKIPTAQWDDVISINLTGVFHTLAASVPHLLAGRNGGSVIVISSSAGLKGVPHLSGYVATKAAVIGLARSLANEVAHRQIRVNVICPGTIDTPMVTANDQQFKLFRPDLADPTLEDCREGFRAMMPTGEPWLAPDRISDAIVFLASDQARYITGVVLPVDQGSANRAV
jgi:(+)-trans-carveol dehydrogenase